ncbi:MAG TPA: hypothetical protein PLE42_07840, partial [Candidatus Competibacteraceae bacterium]|nr:hypothetical protein [Candidatus Competibacteraceae bacterium]
MGKSGQIGAADDRAALARKASSYKPILPWPGYTETVSREQRPLHKPFAAPVLPCLPVPPYRGAPAMSTPETFDLHKTVCV